MAVIGPVLPGEIGIEFPVRRPEPTVANRRVGIECALEIDLPAGRVKDSQYGKDVCVDGRRSQEELEGYGTGDLGFTFQWSGHEGNPVTDGREGDVALLGDRFRLKHMPGGVEIELGPLGTGDGPLILVTLDELVHVPDLELDRRLLVPTVVDPLLKIVEKAELQLAAIVGIEMGPVLQAVHLEPLLI